MRKKGTKNKNYSPEFKISVILDMRNNHLSYSETVRKYWGTQTKAETAKKAFQTNKKNKPFKDAWKMIDWNKPLTFQCGKEKFHNLFKELLEGKTAYSLRHTFATVCQQYVRPDIVDIWMGDSTTRLVGKVYTHFPDEFMLENMLKVQFTQA